MCPPSKSHSDFVTDPSASTEHGGPRTSTVAIHWGFPGSAVTPVVRDPKILGRDRDCDTCLSGRETSRHHAEVRLDGPVALISDLESRNGIYVNGNRVQKSVLQSQDVVRLGDWVGVVVPHDSTLDATFRSIASGWYGSGKLGAIAALAQRIAATDLPVTIQGETGTGKEGMARAIHAWSKRSGQFVGVNCATIQPELAEAALFGYRKGAFTNADRAAIGLFRAANGGTLLLDEVIDLPLAVQAKLLRALEEQEVVPLGETEPVKVDVRVLVATQQSLGQAVSERRFRADLLARLDGLTVVLPPLRERREDIAPLFLRFIQDRSGGNPQRVDPKLIEQLLLYDWPMNVRELSHLARSLLALHAGEAPLVRSSLPDRILRAGGANSADAPKGRAPTQDAEAFESLVSALRASGGNVAQAAATLGITRARAYRLLDAKPEFDVATLRGGGGQP